MFFSREAAGFVLAAALAEAAFSYPDVLLRHLGHPVIGMGAIIGRLDRALNRGRARRARGVVALVALLGSVGGGAWAAERGLGRLPWPLGRVVGALLASSLLAQRSLHAHVAAVRDALEAGDLAASRRAVAHIVGRDPESLDAHGVARAAIESLAENFSDGVTAPLLWGALLGLPGMALYKAANTADSMIGHHTARHERFGWAAARFDDLVNVLPARLAGTALALASGRRAAFTAMRRDARRHRSPNAGWPEAAMAGGLGLALAGPRRYGGATVEDAWMGDGRRAAEAADITRALALYRRACAMQCAVLALRARWPLTILPRT